MFANIITSTSVSLNNDIGLRLNMVNHFRVGFFMAATRQFFFSCSYMSVFYNIFVAFVKVNIYNFSSYYVNRIVAHPVLEQKLD